jgi:hypothetical protein
MHSLKVFNNILFESLRPWKINSDNERFWGNKLSELKRSKYSFQPHFKVSLPGNLNNIRKYYSLIIENEAVDYLNDFHKEMKEAKIKEERIYLINRALQSNINQILKDIDQIITERNYSMDFILSNTPIAQTDVANANESYIFLYLKYQTLRIYRELRKVYEASLDVPILNDDELMYKYFREGIENLKYITEVDKIEGLDSIVKQEKPKLRPKFIDRTYDFRNQKNGVLTYEQMVKNPKLFSVIEEYLYDNEIIDKDFIFKESKQGMTKIKFAALVHQMKKLNYFNSFDPKKRKKIDDLDIWKFINHRYQTDINRQYRDLRNDEEKLREVIEKDFFIGNIGVC